MSHGTNKWSHAWSVILKWSYVIVTALFVFGISRYIYSSLNRPVAATLWTLGAALMFFYYYVKWFVAQSADDPNRIRPTGQACPDYLSIVPPGKLYTPASPSQYFCVDYVGVSRNGGLKKMDPAQIDTQIKNPDYVFSVDPAVDFVSQSAKGKFFQRLIARGLSYGSAGEGGNPRHVPFPSKA
jgi:hypothetical protein